MGPADPSRSYRGRLAPSPTGYLHLGHARTFWVAQARALARSGKLLLRVEELDRARCQPEFVAAMLEDLRWLGFEWQEGLDCGGPYAPYRQSERQAFYHCPLLTDDAGVRLAKRRDALSLRCLRDQGRTPEELRGSWMPGLSSYRT